MSCSCWGVGFTLEWPFLHNLSRDINLAASSAHIQWTNTRQRASEAWAQSRRRILSVSETGLNWYSGAVLNNFTGLYSVFWNLWRIFTSRKSIFGRIRDSQSWWASVSREQIGIEGKPDKTVLKCMFYDFPQYNGFLSLEFLYVLKHISLNKQAIPDERLVFLSGHFTT